MHTHKTLAFSALRFRVTLFSLTASLFFTPVLATAEPLRIAYTSIAMVYGPLWVTKEAGLFKKYNIDAELLYIAGGPPSLQALIAGDVAVSFTAAGAVVAANLAGSDVVLLGTSIDSLPFELGVFVQLAHAEQRIDQQFFDRYARILRIIKLVITEDKAEILKPISGPECASFVKDVTGKAVEGDANLAVTAQAIGKELENLKKYLDQKRNRGRHPPLST